MSRNAVQLKHALSQEAKEAAYQFLRESKLSKLVSGMAAAVRSETGESFGMRDVSAVFEAWFGNKEPTARKHKVAFEHLKGLGREGFRRITDGVAAAIKKSTGKVGYKDVGEVIIAFADGRALTASIVRRFKAGKFAPGDEVWVKASHGFVRYRGDRGIIEKLVPYNKAYVVLRENGRVLVDLDDIEKA